MDTATPAPLSSATAPSRDRPSPPPSRRPAAPGGEQPRLPLGEAAEPPRPPTRERPEDEHERPIGFALTARARRAVAPHSLPDLAVVPADDGGAELPDDTRPARARALRRAGVSIARIAAQLDTDPLVVTAWTGEVAVRSHGPSRLAHPGSTANVADGSVGGGALDQDPVQDPDADDTARALARADAARRARDRLADDASFARAAGLLAGIVEVDEHAVTVATDEVRIARQALEALTGEHPDAVILARVVARVGPEAAGDLVRHRLAADLGLEVSQVTWSRWRGAPHPDAVRTLLRVADPTLADAVAGMVEAVLDPEGATGPVEF